MATHHTSDRLIGESGKQYHQSENFNEWVRLVFDKSNRETYGNFTRAALIAHRLDPHNETDYNSAAKIGYKNYRKVQDLASRFLDKKNISFGFLMDMLIAKAAKSSTLDAWNVLMDFREYDRPNKNQEALPSNTQYNFFNLDHGKLAAVGEETGANGISTEEFTRLFIKGDQAGQPGAIVDLHRAELPGEDSQDPDLSAP